MALVLECDGCTCRLPQESAVARGQIERVFYCVECAGAVDQLAAALDAERVRLATAFEVFRAERMAEARTALKRLPDE